MTIMKRSFAHTLAVGFLAFLVGATASAQVIDTPPTEVEPVLRVPAEDFVSSAPVSAAE
jgi:hypothetical protein